MNIGFLYTHPPGESMGSMNRVRFLCDGLVKLHHNCFILTSFSGFKEWNPKIKFINISDLLNKKFFSKKIYQILRWILDIKYFSNFTIINPFILNKIIKKLSNDLVRTTRNLPYKLDVIIGEQELAGFVLIQKKEELNCPIIINYHNYWPEELVEHNIIHRSGKKYKYLVNLEKKLINNGDLIITNGESLRDFLIKTLKIKNINKIVSISNGATPILTEPKKKSLPPKIINAGMVVHRSNIKLFLNSIPFILKEYPNSQIYITRKGEELNDIMKLNKKMNLKINFYWKDSHKEFLHFLSECNVGVVTSSNSISRKIGFPSKILDYLSVGVPVVGNDIGGWTSIIEENKVGLLSSNNPKDLAKKIIELIKNSEYNYKCGQNAINLMKNEYNIQNSVIKLLEYIKKI